MTYARPTLDKIAVALDEASCTPRPCSGPPSGESYIALNSPTPGPGGDDRIWVSVGHTYIGPAPAYPGQCFEPNLGPYGDLIQRYDPHVQVALRVNWHFSNDILGNIVQIR